MFDVEHLVSYRFVQYCRRDKAGMVPEDKNVGDRLVSAAYGMQGWAFGLSRRPVVPGHKRKRPLKIEVSVQIF